MSGEIASRRQEYDPAYDAFRQAFTNLCRDPRTTHGETPSSFRMSRIEVGKTALHVSMLALPVGEQEQLPRELHSHLWRGARLAPDEAIYMYGRREFGYSVAREEQPQPGSGFLAMYRTLIVVRYILTPQDTIQQVVQVESPDGVSPVLLGLDHMQQHILPALSQGDIALPNSKMIVRQWHVDAATPEAIADAYTWLDGLPEY